jgi:hypothetical protein
MQEKKSICRMLGLGVAIGGVLLACGSPKSSSTSGPDGGAVPTSKMSIRLTIESAEPGKVVVRANLNDGDVLGNSFRLDGGDYLLACIAGNCKNMADNDSVYTPDYIARFDYQSGVDYIVSFNRRAGGNAPDSRAKLPPAFSLVTPVDHQPVTTGDIVQVSWAPATTARVGLRYVADCTFASGAKASSGGGLFRESNAADHDSVAIDPIIEFAQKGTPSAITRCTITLTVNHELDGRVDPAFDDGYALGIVSRSVVLDYTPR